MYVECLHAVQMRPIRGDDKLKVVQTGYEVMEVLCMYTPVYVSSTLITGYGQDVGATSYS